MNVKRFTQHTCIMYLTGYLALQIDTYAYIVIS